MIVKRAEGGQWLVNGRAVMPPHGADESTFVLELALQEAGGRTPLPVEVHEAGGVLHLVVRADGSVASHSEGTITPTVLGWLRPAGAIEVRAVLRTAPADALMEGKERAMSDAYSARAVFEGGDRAAGYLEEAAEPVRPAVIPPKPIASPPAVTVAAGPVSVGASVGVPEVVPGARAVSVEELGALGAGDAPVRARAGFLGVLAQLGLPVRAGVGERRRAEAAALMARYEAVIRQTTWTRPVSVLVADKKGGVGKTTCAVGIASAIASIRGGGLAVLEVSDDPGSLTFRTEGSPRRGVGELVRDLRAITNRGQLSGYTAPQTSFASVIGSVGHRPPLTREDVVGMSSVVDEYFEIRVMDSGNQPSSPAFQGAIECADVLVVPLLNAGDAAAAAIQTLEALRAQGPKARSLADNAIVIRLTDGQREIPEIRDHITALLEQAGITDVYEIPFDDHLADRGQITWGRCAPSTRAAFTAAAAGVVCALQAADQPIQNY